MNALVEKDFCCPYCGETISALIDTSVSHQTYIEDCEVCCRPINIDANINHAGELTIRAYHENE